jgi:hypothetical protein
MDVQVQSAAEAQGRETREKVLKGVVCDTLSWNTLHHLVGHSIVPHVIARA